MGAANFSGAGLTGAIEKKIRVDDILWNDELIGTDYLVNDPDRGIYLDIEALFGSGLYQNQFNLQVTSVLVYVDSDTLFGQLDTACQMDGQNYHNPDYIACGSWHPMKIRRIYRRDTTESMRITIGGIHTI